MPTYEYICQICQHRFEKFQSITAKPLQRCPKCGKNGLKKVIGSGAGILFRGSGFYQTDYRTQSYKKAAEKEKTSPEKKTKKEKTDAKDSKPQTKTTPGENNN